MPLIRENLPDASTLINSMRSIGYEFETAIADIIDNAISARAKTIDIFVPIRHTEEIFLHILDDGNGMDDNELFEAMRFGSIKDQERDQNDLGRFGLGLKTATFSQCKRLTVVSKKDNEINGYSWDLELVSKTRSWNIQKLSNDEINKIKNVNKLKEYKNGTIVIWESFDTLDKDVTIFNTLHDVFMRKVSSSEKHISLVFHRFMEKKIKIRINGQELIPFDPFLQNHPKTTIKDEQTIVTTTSDGRKEKVKMQVFVLPYHKDLSERDYEKLGGHDEIDNQGFYIYRNNRLMVYGTWFKIKPKAELSRNARIRIDLPNTLDDVWSIDIKKQKAVIPKSLHEQLRKEVSDAVEKSKRIYEYKGTVETKEGSIWVKKENHRTNQVTYEINTESPLIKNLILNLDDKEKQSVNKILQLVQLSLPYRAIYNSVSEKKDINVPNENEIDVLLYDAYMLALDLMKRSKLNKDETIDRICSYEPYRSANIKEKLREKIYG